jgi:hypothetical protein
VQLYPDFLAPNLVKQPCYRRKTLLLDVAEQRVRMLGKIARFWEKVL